MPRLIDLDDDRNCYIGNDGEYERYNIDPDVIAEAVDIVRCRDCEWYKTNYSWNGKERKVCGIEPFEPIRQEEDYCAYGERRG